MCQQTRGSIHKCGHPRTRGLFARCAKSHATGLWCMDEAGPLRSPTLCYDCEEVERACGKLRKRDSLAEHIVLPET